ncbi:MAG: Hsp70 family protein [Acidimicrobiia bacterium]|nr:Hsp70 family protein [Acidimicrobiia bacterium]
MSRPVAVDLGAASVRSAVQFGTRTVFLAIEPRGTDVRAHLTRALRAARDLGPKAESGPEVVVTVPGSLDPAARAALRSEIEAAGAVMRRALGHAAASVIAHAVTRTEPQRLLVVDIGSGSTDVAVVDADRDTVEVRASTGDPDLGGTGVDAALATHVAAQAAAATGVDLGASEAGASLARRLAAVAKVDLSHMTETRIHLPVVQDRQVDLLDIDVSRSEIEALAGDLLDRWDRLVTQVMLEAGTGPAEIDEVLVVGAAGRMPGIRAMLRRHVDRHDALTLAGPELPAAGAAVLAEALAGHRPEPTVFETLGMAICLVHAGSTQPVLPYGSPLPARRVVKVALGPAEGRATLQAVRPVRGEKPQVRRLVEVVLPTGPGRGHVRVDVDTDGFVDVQVSREDSDR